MADDGSLCDAYGALGVVNAWLLSCKCVPVILAIEHPCTAQTALLLGFMAVAMKHCSHG